MAEFSKDWIGEARCQSDPDAMFVTGAEQNIAKRICASCVVKLECLADALDNRIEYGVWGGMTERQRRALLRRHPGVPSWRDVFQAAVLRAGGETPTINKVDKPTEVAGAAGATAMGVETSDAAPMMPEPWAATPPDGLPEEGA